MEISDIEENMDLQAFNRIFGESQHRFIRFACSYISDPVVAEDIVMESFTAAWENRAILNPTTFSPYTLTIVKNKCLNYLRAQSVRQRAAVEIHSHELRMLNVCIASLEACDPHELYSEETRRLIDKALEALPRRTREIFVRSRFDGESYKQIAAQMEITVKSVEFEVSKATKILRIALKDYLPVISFWLYIN